MEQRDLPALMVAIESVDDIGSMIMVQRRLAIQSFLVDPASAIQLYPQLGTDLVSFFSQSSNPHINDETGLPVRGREADYEKWRIAQVWARTYQRYC
jgi:hypothetical protein